LEVLLCLEEMEQALMVKDRAQVGALVQVQAEVGWEGITLGRALVGIVFALVVEQRFLTRWAFLAIT